MGPRATAAAAQVINEVVSFIVFLALDVLDVILCLVYKLVDYLVEAEWKPCYCSATNASSGILVPESGGLSTNVVCVSSSKLQFDDVSDTLYSRPSLVSDVSREMQRMNIVRRRCFTGTVAAAAAKFTVRSAAVEMLEGKIGGRRPQRVPRWSDCDCKDCNSWSHSPGRRDSLFVHVEGPRGGALAAAKEDVLFIHGFISSSSFWTGTVFPNFTEATRTSYRLFAMDLLGFGRSPKPANSLYTLREHIDMIERSVLENYKVGSFHIVAHSLGSILALALAVRHPGAVKSITLLAPPYFAVPKGEQKAAQYVLRRVAPRRVWPAIAFGASLVGWYEHISRTICLVICKNHRLWEFIFKLLTRNRINTFLMEGFFSHTHNAAWHTLHNIICGSAGKMEGYLDAVREQLSCDVTVFHGQHDELIPVDCSYAVKSSVPRTRVVVVDRKDHITVVVGRQKAFARELEDIWSNAKR